MLITASHTPLADTLNDAVVLPDDPRYDEARSSFNLLVDQRPAAVAFPSDAREVAAAVALAERLGLRVAPQATAHNQAPLGDMDDLLLVNVSRLQEVRIDPGARSVRVGAGVKWDRVAPRLSAHGLAGLHGSSPDVGIAGYSLGGGMGWLARKHGLQTNAVTALELVTAEGELIRVDADHEPELFWALRGGGGNFGIVTAIEFDVVEVDELYAGAYFFPFERADEVLHTWNAMRHSFPDELMSWASLLHFPPIPDVPAFARGRSYAVVMAAYLGSAGEGDSLLRRCAASAPSATRSPACRRRARRPRHGPARPGALPEHLGAARRAAARGDRRHARRGRPESGRGPTVSMLQLRQMGGALARATPGAGARATLPGDISMFALGAVFDEPMREAVHAALADVDGCPAALPRRLLPQLRRGAGRRPRLLRSGDLGAPARGQGGLRPGQRVRGQPPHPAGLGVRDASGWLCWRGRRRRVSGAGGSGSPACGRGRCRGRGACWSAPAAWRRARR